MNDNYCEVETAFETFINELTRIQDSAQQQFEQFKQHTAARQLKVKKCADVSSSKQIKLDIGGTVFKTTEETLLSKKDTFFTAMLSGSWEPDPDTGAYFIDRSADKFGSILQYLRSGKLPCIDGWTAHDQELFQQDLDFYSLNEEVYPSEICWDISETPKISFDRSQLSCWLNTRFISMHIPDEVLEQDAINWSITSEHGADVQFIVPYGVNDSDAFRIRFKDGKISLAEPRSDFPEWEKVADWADDEPIQTNFCMDNTSNTLTVSLRGKKRVIQRATLQGNYLPHLRIGGNFPKICVQPSAN